MEGSMVGRLESWFWKESFWLPGNVTWAIMAGDAEAGGPKNAQFRDLYFSVFVALALLVIRYTLERTVFRRLGVLLGIKERGADAHRSEDVKIFTKALTTNGHMNHTQTTRLAKELNMTERNVQLWIQRRAIQEKKLAKFTETAWRFIFYASVFVYGIYVLWDKPWLWDTLHCWYDFPHHPIANETWWYYMVELGFYVSCTLSHFVNTKRKDFWQMFIHHIVTIFLLCLSWIMNLHRVGSLVLIVHDFADVPLEFARMARYATWLRLANALFAVFTVSWIVSRVGLYPYRVVYSVVVDAPRIVGMAPIYYIFASLLMALQLMHIIWTWMILRAALQAITHKGVEELGSADESTDEEDQPAIVSNGSHKAADSKGLKPKNRKAD
ncbi:unnamed protein product [Ixodes pacificus]